MKVGLIVAEIPDWKVNMIPGSDSYPLGLLSISSYARVHARVATLDTALFRDTDNLIEYRPDVVGISAVTNGYHAIRPIAQRVKEELGVPVILGGSHVTGLPESMPGECDVGVIGEGEETFRELLEALDAGPLDPSTLSRVRGIVYRDGGRLVRTEPRPFIEDLDMIPIPDRSLAAGQWSSPVKADHMLCSRGCPYPCTFCSIHSTMGRRVRFHSASRIVQEIRSIHEESHPEVIAVWDDLFTASKARARALVRELEETELHREAVFGVPSRTDLIDEEWCDIFRRMNVAVVSLGVESVSDRVLRFMGKESISIETSMRAVDTLARAGIGAGVNFILGAPGETRDDLVRTFHYILDNSDKLYGVLVNHLRAYPGTKVWDYAKRMGLVDERNFDGVAPRPCKGGVSDNRDFILNHYAYLNEKNVPREEFVSYCELFDKVRQVLPPWYERKLRLRAAEEETRRLRKLQERPLFRIVGGRVKRKLRHALSGIRAPGAHPYQPVL